MGSRHRAAPAPCSHGHRAPGQARHGPHLCLRLGVPSLGLLQEFFKGDFHVCLHGPFTAAKTDRQDVTGLVLSLVRVDRTQEWASGLEQRLAWKSGQRCMGVQRGHPSDPAPRGGARTANVGAAAQSPPWVSQEGRGAQARRHHRPSAHCSSNYGSRKARGSGLKAPDLRKEPTPQ